MAQFQITVTFPNITAASVPDSANDIVQTIAQRVALDIRDELVTDLSTDDLANPTATGSIS